MEAHPQIAEGFCGMEIMGKAYTEKADAGEILLAACKDTKSADLVPLGSYRGFQMELSFDSFRNEFDVTLKGAVSHRVALGTDARGNITRLDNALAGIPERLERANEQLNNLYNQQEAAKAEVGKPFPQEAELTVKSQRLAELDLSLIHISNWKARTGTPLPKNRRFCRIMSVGAVWQMPLTRTRAVSYTHL